MEYQVKNELGLFGWLTEDESSGFARGANSTSSLDPAFLSGTSAEDDIDLPEWMESRSTLQNETVYDGSRKEIVYDDSGLIGIDRGALLLHDEKDKMDFFHDLPEIHQSVMEPMDFLNPLPSMGCTEVRQSEESSSHLIMTQPPRTPSPPARYNPQHIEKIIVRVQNSAAPTFEIIPRWKPIPEVKEQCYTPEDVKEQIYSPVNVNEQIYTSEDVKEQVYAPIMAEEQVYTPIVDNNMHEFLQPAHDPTSVTLEEMLVESCNPDDILDELVGMVGTNDSGEVDNLALAQTLTEADVDELLSHLESDAASLSSDTYSVPSVSPSSSCFTSPAHSTSGYSSITSPAQSNLSTVDLSLLSPASSAADPEWVPTPSSSSSSRSRNSGRRNTKSSTDAKPYIVDRKLRKKEQNKQAATRYRQKKKVEHGSASDILEIEEKRREELEERYKGMKQELGYLKKIMREVFVAKGIISPEVLAAASVKK